MTMVNEMSLIEATAGPSYVPGQGDSLCHPYLGPDLNLTLHPLENAELQHRIARTFTHAPCVTILTKMNAPL